jgi:tryptophan-rich sensory protein
LLVQLTLNAAWSVIVVSLQQRVWALLEIVALRLLIGPAIRVCGRVQRAAAWLLTSGLAWVSFASVLNAAILWTN